MKRYMITVKPTDGESFRAILQADSERHARSWFNKGAGRQGAELAELRPALKNEGEGLPIVTAESRCRSEEDKKAHGDVPEKSFVGMVLRGRGWSIDYSAAYDRAVVRFTRIPSAAAKAAVKAAGWYYSPQMTAWTRGLTHKSWRAGQTLALELRQICG